MKEWLWSLTQQEAINLVYGVFIFLLFLRVIGIEGRKK